METKGLLEEPLTRSIIGAFFEVYNTLGFGFLERLYVLALERELRQRGHYVEREFRVRGIYKGELLGIQRLDLVVDHKVVLLLHFGPSARFYRLIHRNDERSAPIRSLSRESVSDGPDYNSRP